MSGENGCANSFFLQKETENRKYLSPLLCSVQTVHVNLMHGQTSARGLLVDNFQASVCQSVSRYTYYTYCTVLYRYTVWMDIHVIQPSNEES